MATNEVVAVDDRLRWLIRQSCEKVGCEARVMTFWGFDGHQQTRGAQITHGGEILDLSFTTRDEDIGRLAQDWLDALHAPLVAARSREHTFVDPSLT